MSEDRTEGDNGENVRTERIEVEPVNYGGYVHPLTLLPSDNLGLSIIANQLNESNYLTWSHAMKRALSAKNKFGFVDGSVVKPGEADVNLPQWLRVNDTVVAWILNSLSPDLIDGFSLAETAKDLWDELKTQFGTSNGPQIYQLNREISSIAQGNMSLSVYFSKLKRLWDELGHLAPEDECVCGGCVCKLTRENKKEGKSRLIQFLMGLNDSYEAVRNQILASDPWPDVRKAYALLLNVEKQQSVRVMYENIDQSAMMARRTGNNYTFRNTHLANRENDIRRDKVYKRGLKCEHCGINGHSRESCFKLIGFPDWWKGSRETETQQGSNLKKYANYTETPLDLERESPINSSNDLDSILNSMKMLQQEVDKLVKGKGPLKEADGVNFAHFMDFSGPNN